MVCVGLTLPTHAQQTPADGLAGAEDPPAAQELADGIYIELIEPGERPQLRRFRYSVGESATLRLVVDTQTKVDTGLGGDGEVLPALEQVLSVRVVDVDDEGTATIEGVIDRVTLRPNENVRQHIFNAIDQAVEPIRGARMSYRVDSHGNQSDEKVTAPDGGSMTDPTMQQSMLDAMKAASTAIPREPFGVGAVWIECGTSTVNGVTTSNLSTFTVEAIKGDSIYLRSDTTSTLTPHFVEDAMMPPGVQIRMDGSTIQGTAHSMFSLTSLQSSIRTRTTGNVYMTIFENGQELAMRQWTSMAIEGATTGAQ